MGNQVIHPSAGSRHASLVGEHKSLTLKLEKRTVSPSDFAAFSCIVAD
jgi:hypothetical protein